MRIKWDPKTLRTEAATTNQRTGCKVSGCSQSTSFYMNREDMPAILKDCYDAIKVKG